MKDEILRQFEARLIEEEIGISRKHKAMSDSLIRLENENIALKNKLLETEQENTRIIKLRDNVIT